MSAPGNNAYSVTYLESVVAKDMIGLPKAMSHLIKVAIEARLLVEPVGLGKPLQYSVVGHRRIRVGDYRVVYRVDSKARLVTIVLIAHRREVYDEE